MNEARNPGVNPEDVNPEDLAGYVLGALDEAEQAAVEARLQGAEPQELDEVRKHLALHDALPTLQPLPAMWRSLEDRINSEEGNTAAGPSTLHRFWMPAAAAALMAAAFLWPNGATPASAAPTAIVSGNVSNDGGTYASTTVARLTVGDGVLLTLDTTTSVTFPAPERLALDAGRVFLEVAPSRRGYTVEAGGLTVETTGTAFSVERNGDRTGVVVEKGSVRCTVGDETVTVEAGRSWSAAAGFGDATAPRRWFTCPTLEATILTPDTVRVVIRNDMPDPITLAPPTAGEPLFLASVRGHTLPLTPASADALTARNVRLEPGEVRTVKLRLPRRLADDEPLQIAYPRSGVRVEATR